MAFESFPKIVLAEKGRWLVWRLVMVGLMLMTLPVQGALPCTDWLQWDELPNLPSDAGTEGVLVGTMGDAMIVAGGRRQVESGDGHQLVYVDDVYALQSGASGYQWSHIGKLPRAIADSAVVPVPDGLACIGGADAKGEVDTAFVLKWNPVQKQLTFRTLPSLVAQGDGERTCLFLFAGRNGRQDLVDAHRFEPIRYRWQSVAPLPEAVGEGHAVAVGQAHIALFGDSTDTDGIKKQEKRPQTWMYHTITDT